MNTNRLTSEMADMLNEQMAKEAHAAQIYLSYGAWASSEGYGGVANFLFRHAQEERNHMMKILEYILQRGARVKVGPVAAAPPDPSGINDCFEKIFQHELDNTAAVYKVVRLSHDSGDWATLHFMQWFVKEQVEEETLAMNLLDKIKIAGGSSANSEALFMLDKELAKEPDEAKMAEDATAEQP
jgi:ferritin